MSTASRKKPNRINRLQVGTNVLTQLFVFFCLVAMLNYLSFRHFKRWDYSRDHKYSLSEQTQNLLKSLSSRAKVTVFFSSATEIAPDVNALLREYQYFAGKNFEFEVIDPYRNFTRAQELQAKYKFGAAENILILDFAGRSKFVNAADLADFEQPDQASIMAGQSQPKLKAFKGEQALTSALLELTQGKSAKVCYITGHGEPDLAAQELKVFNESLKRQNIDIAATNLLSGDGVPPDTRALIICGPKYDLSELEIKVLTDFWQNKGRLLVLLNPYVKTTRLAAWLQEMGIIPEEDQVIKTGTFLETDANGNPQLKSGVIRRAAFSVVESGTSITKGMVGLSKQLLGVSQSLTLEKPKANTSKTLPILQSVKGFWGEVDAESPGQTPFFDPKKDHMGPLTLAAAVEKGGLGDSRVKVDTSRLIVIGNAEFLSNDAYRLSEGVNIDLAINAFNWLLDRVELMGIPPKVKHNVPLSLDESQMGSLALLVMLVVPGSVAVLGLLVWWRRRA